VYRSFITENFKLTREVLDGTDLLHTWSEGKLKKKGAAYF